MMLTVPLGTKCRLPQPLPPAGTPDQADMAEQIALALIVTLTMNRT